MMKGLNLEHHFSLESSVLIKEMFNPLLFSLGITYFNYIKIYNKDCSRELLTNNPDWIKHFYKNSLFNSIGAVDVEHLLPKGYFLWSELEKKDPIYIEGRDFFNIDNGITFVIKREDITYLYIFAANKANYSINNFYVANIDLLQRFIHYFNDKAQILIKKAEKNRIWLPGNQIINQCRVANKIISEKLRQEFLSKSKVNRYFLLNESDNLYLTEKQAECAKFIVKGYASKVIAQEMNISHRTVEGYILGIKGRLQIALGKELSKPQIIKLLEASKII